MNVLLNEIATVTSGYTFRQSVPIAAQGGIRLIQMKDLGADGVVQLQGTVRINVPSPKAQHRAQCGDILFRSRGQRPTAALINQECTNTIISGPLFRIRADATRIMPQYLLWQIHHPHAQRYFARSLEGSVGMMISMRTVCALPITVPCMARQRTIAHIYALSLREKRILHRVQQKKRAYIQAALTEYAALDSAPSPTVPFHAPADNTIANQILCTRTNKEEQYNE